MSRDKKEKFCPRDFIGFILFMAILGAIFYAINKNANSTAYICLTVLAVIIMLFWLSPTISELVFISKKAKLKVKQGRKR